ncbi:lysine 2,3-aminomutase [Methanospirillum sp. J.3.6.1-F.2.7.3]|uniref:L-lysine 2,3-aminomutase n=1 Tax=Methanospirillum purgamenti TaxID=2834276 RepID=A0A8E7EKX2_9EURY|nr:MULTISPECIES: lysine 2,3-aminomutase [Methanospirillum]MDX8549863.1 lysine 2,3-aminomutase [Methanospirillum hungatei]QVV90000.1 lysine 2,3-aminomutase [Methanospirillum sp. J.3.6.1-F.2.7.3]
MTHIKTIPPSIEQAAEENKQRWKDWKWQVGHSITDIKTLERMLDIPLSDTERKDIQKTCDIFPMSITPYYLSLIDTHDPYHDPIFKQAVPSVGELIIEDYDIHDPLGEDADSPCPLITHRYPDRILFLISNTCAMYCRHCTRKRKVGQVSSIPLEEELEAAYSYIENHPEIRDVLLSGGDPLMLSDHQLDRILSRLRKIPHIEIIRIGSRVPVVLPFRITDNLVSILKKYHPLWLNTHFNHPKEFTDDSRNALAKLADAGIPLGNQSVLLAGVNDCPVIMKKLVQELVKNRVRPYYLFQCDLAEGLAHFRTPVGKGIEIIESLIGHTSGLAVPTYVIDAPGGGGKIPVMPYYLVSWSSNKVVLRNYEGMCTTYQEPSSYEGVTCDLRCESCVLQHSIDEESAGKRAQGIEALLSDYENDITILPADLDRISRRADGD